MNAKSNTQLMQHLLWRCDTRSLFPFLQDLRSQCDVRLVRSALVLLRLLCSSQQHPLKVRALADTLADDSISSTAWEKRLHNLLRSSKWSHELLQRHLWLQAHELFEHSQHVGRDCLALWDDSVFEKPETLKDSGLGPVRSLQAKRLNRVRPSYFSPPKGTTCVAGLRMSALVVATAKDSRIARCEFWNSREHPKGHTRTVQVHMLEQAVSCWGRQIVHVFDRGYAGWPWLQELYAANVRFVMRWNSKFNLLGTDKVQKAYHSVSGRKRTKLMVTDAIKRKKKARWVVWRQLAHPQQPEKPLWLVVCSDRKRKPWYLLTSEPVESKEQARRIIQWYARRWEVEQQFRRIKHDMKAQTIQLREPTKRLKLLNIVLLAQNTLMMLARQKEVVQVLLKQFCPRRGKRLNKKIKIAFERIKTARTKLRLCTEQTNQAMWNAAPHCLILLLRPPP